MGAGRRRHPVEVQKYTYTQDEYGGMIEEWVTLGTEWASIDSISGKEFVAAAAPQSVTTTRITIAYRDDLTTGHRFAFHGKKYDIKALLPNNTMSELVCMCDVGLID